MGRSTNRRRATARGRWRASMTAATRCIPIPLEALPVLTRHRPLIKSRVMGIESLSETADSKAQSTKVQVRLFGPPRFVVHGEEQTLPDKAFVLLAILAASANKTASRSQIRSIL